MNATNTLALLRSERHISASALTSYLLCSQAFKFRYLDKLKPSHQPGPLVLGSAIHAGLAEFYRALRDGKPEPKVQTLQEVFREDLRRRFADSLPVLLDDDQTESSLIEQGAAMLETFHSQAPRPFRVIGVEEPFSIEVHDPETGEVPPVRLVGAFDAVFQEPNGRYVIAEHKTSGRKWTADRLASDLQLTSYTFAASAVGLGDAAIQLQVLLKTKTPGLDVQRLRRSEQDRRDFLTVATGVLRAIEAQAFYPSRGGWQCRSCQYAGPCLAG